MFCLATFTRRRLRVALIGDAPAHGHRARPRLARSLEDSCRLTSRPLGLPMRLTVAPAPTIRPCERMGAGAPPSSLDRPASDWGRPGCGRRRRLPRAGRGADRPRRADRSQWAAHRRAIVGRRRRHDGSASIATSSMDTSRGSCRGSPTPWVSSAFAAVVEIVLVVQRRWWALLIAPIGLGARARDVPHRQQRSSGRPRPDVVPTRIRAEHVELPVGSHRGDRRAVGRRRAAVLPDLGRRSTGRAPGALVVAARVRRRHARGSTAACTIPPTSSSGALMGLAALMSPSWPSACGSATSERGRTCTTSARR